MYIYTNICCDKHMFLFCKYNKYSRHFFFLCPSLFYFLCMYTVI